MKNPLRNKEKSRKILENRENFKRKKKSLLIKQEYSRRENDTTVNTLLREGGNGKSECFLVCVSGNLM